LSRLPEQMADHWARPMLQSGRGRLYWHILLGNEPGVQTLIEEAQRRLAGLPGLDMTPQRWLHLTVLIAGLADEFTTSQVDTMLIEARRSLRDVDVMTVTLSRVLYHPEAVVVAARPAEKLTPLLQAVQAATRSARGHTGVLGHEPWVPHVTLAYSSGVQPAAPVIAALGKELPPCQVAIRTISLVNQLGAEYMWDWRPIAEVPVGAPSIRCKIP